MANRLARWGQRFALDYDRPNDLFRTRVSLAPSRADLAGGGSGLIIRDARGLIVRRGGRGGRTANKPANRELKAKGVPTINTCMPVNATAPTTAASISLTLEMAERIAARACLTFSGLMVGLRRRLADTNERSWVRTQKIVELTRPNRALRAIITDEIELLVRIESFVRARCSFRSMDPAPERFPPRRDRLPSLRADSPRESCPHSSAPWLSPRRRCSRSRPPPRLPPPRLILPTRNWSSHCNARRLPQCRQQIRAAPSPPPA